MSIDTWKAEFMPTPANQVTGDDEALLTHCLRKWEGILHRNLVKHELAWHDAWQHLIATDTCSLCQRYYVGMGEHACVNCPLYKEYGRDCNAVGSPYQDVMRDYKAAPMVIALTAILANMKEQD